MSLILHSRSEKTKEQLQKEQGKQEDMKGAKAYYNNIL